MLWFLVYLDFSLYQFIKSLGECFYLSTAQDRGEEEWVQDAQATSFEPGTKDGKLMSGWDAKSSKF